MLNLHKHWLTAIIVGLIMPVISTYAADESVPYTQGRWSGTATAGLMIWNDLNDLEPAAGGGFDSVGFVAVALRPMDDAKGFRLAPVG